MTEPPNIDLGLLASEALRLDASICAESFEDFCRGAWPDLEPNGRPFIETRSTTALIRHLQAVGDGEIRRLGIAIAPGLGKSTFASVAFPAWMWTRDPAWRAICASHAHSLATQIAGKSLRLITGDWYRERFGIHLIGERVDAFTNQHSGARYSVGVGGALTGLRGDGGIIDDAINAVAAKSDVELQRVCDWYDQAFCNRLDRGDDAPIITIGQRLAIGDLLGHLFRRGGYEELVLASEFDSARRCVTSVWRDDRETDGELLAPEIQSATYLAEQKLNLGSSGFAAQFNERPADDGAAIIKRIWWRFYRPPHARADAPRPAGCETATDAVDMPDNFDRVVIAADLTFGSVDGDWAVAQAWGSRGSGRYLLEQWRQRAGFEASSAAIKAMAQRYSGAKVLIEKAANGAAVIERLSAEIPGVIGLPPRGKKPQRLAAIAPTVESGCCFLPLGWPGLADFVEEVAGATKHDDQSDTAAYAIADLARAPQTFSVGPILFDRAPPTSDY